MDYIIKGIKEMERKPWCQIMLPLSDVTVSFAEALHEKEILESEICHLHHAITLAEQTLRMKVSRLREVDSHLVRHVKEPIKKVVVREEVKMMQKMMENEKKTDNVLADFLTFIDAWDKAGVKG